MACARRCHLLRNTSTNFRRFVPGNFCDCSRSDYCICKCSDRRTIFDNLADRHGSRPKRGIDLETMEFDKLQVSQRGQGRTALGKVGLYVRGGVIRLGWYGIVWSSRD
jgi:hypothetical protein